MTHAAPLALHRDTVRPEWIDYNGHLNIAYYLLMFDHATDVFFDYLGIGPDYIKAANCSTFVLESHIVYERELAVGAPVRFTTQLLDFDEKRFLYLHAMIHETEEFLAATCEMVSLHVDMATRRTAPFQAPMQGLLADIKKAHDALGTPPQAGRSISLRSRKR